MYRFPQKTIIANLQFVLFVAILKKSIFFDEDYALIEDKVCDKDIFLLFCNTSIYYNLLQFQVKSTIMIFKKLPCLFWTKNYS